MLEGLTKYFSFAAENMDVNIKHETLMERNVAAEIFTRFSLRPTKRFFICMRSVCSHGCVQEWRTREKKRKAKEKKGDRDM